MERCTLRRWLLALGSTGILVFALLTGYWLAGPAVDCPAERPCDDLSWLQSGAVRTGGLMIHDHRGELISTVGSGRRLYTPLEEIPLDLRRAWVGVEDRRFEEHGGVDLRAVARAALANLSAGSVREGASTIPMQLVRTIWSDAVQDMGRWHRKWFEATMARQLVDELGRQRVLELYLNSIYLGEGVYGIGAAAHHYWGLSPEELDLAQTATLVGMTKSPGNFQPRSSPEAARERRAVVLAQLVDEGIIDARAARIARAAESSALPTAPSGFGWDWVSAEVRRRLDHLLPPNTHYRALKVFTTIQPQRQEAAESLVVRHTRRIASGEFGDPGRPGTPPQAAVVLMDAQSGAIRALVGGRDYGASKFNRATQSERPVGSLAKPLLVASALERGVAATDTFSTSAIRRASSNGVWEPRDHVELPTLVPKSVLVHSSNRAAVRIGRRVGIDRFSHTLQRLGMEADVPRHPTAYLGAFGASLVDVTGAYATLGNGGYRVRPHLVERIEDAEGRVLWRGSAEAQRPAVSGATAFQVVDALRSAVEEGTGWRAAASSGSAHVAGKTGTTNEVEDAWFVGLTPRHAAGIWVGHDAPATVVEEGSGGRLAAPLWGKLMASDSGLLGHPDSVGWTRPASLRQAWVDPTTGTIRAGDCPFPPSREAVQVWVQRLSLPHQLDRCRPSRLRYRPADLDGESTLLHTPPTIRVPPELRRTSNGGG
jgi:penicillin-binding protein 1A